MAKVSIIRAFALTVFACVFTFCFMLVYSGQYSQNVQQCDECVCLPLPSSAAEHQQLNSSVAPESSGSKASLVNVAAVPVLANMQSRLSNERMFSKLQQASHHLLRAHRMVVPSDAAKHLKTSIFLIDDLLSEIRELASETTIVNEINSTASADVELPAIKSKHVCPEFYNGSTYGYPFFYTGFVTTNCSGVPQFHHMLTIVLNFIQYASEDLIRLPLIIRNIKEVCETCSIFIAADMNFSMDATTPNVVVRRYPGGTNIGAAWNDLIKNATTEYVFLGRDIAYFSWHSRLERLVREITQLKVTVAGSSSRTMDGLWTLGCNQATFINYTLTYREGYDTSMDECLYCDYIKGPFVAKRSFMMDYPLDQTMSETSSFVDFFLRISKDGHSTVVCPDAMNFVRPTSDSNNRKETWLALASKWTINALILSSHVEFRFSCSESRTRCKYVTGKAVPPCCLQKLADMIKFTLTTCKSEGMMCELQEGTLLGAVKLGKVLPWERDADLTFHTGNFSHFKTLTAHFDAAGYKLVVGRDPWCCVDGVYAGGTYTILGDGWVVELYGQHLMDSEILARSGVATTRVAFDGAWVPTPTNPALYCRNRYGHEVFKHAQHWQSMNSQSGWDAYNPTQFSPCEEPGHMSCLDQYIADGNIQFEVPRA